MNSLTPIFSLSSYQKQELVSLINEAYHWSEHQMWKKGYKRISLQEVEDLLDKGSMKVYMVEGRLAGTVTLKSISTEIAGFGLLAVAKQFLGKGYGKTLIDLAEQEIRDSRHMQIEVEIVRSFEVEMPHKDLLDQWYRKLGYQYQQTYDLEERYPFLVPSLICNGKCVVYAKKL